jgi:excisionase family DNA binding protein
MSSAPWLTVSEVARELGVSEWWVRERIARGEIPAVPHTRIKRIPRSFLVDLERSVRQSASLDPAAGGSFA